MANIHTSNRLAPGWQPRRAVEGRNPITSGPSPALLQTLAVAGRRLLGAVLLPLGILLMSTLVLLPVGLPLALFAVALLAAPALRK
jgi:hypothetical protein